jgi:hypothetical protein
MATAIKDNHSELHQSFRDMFAGLASALPKQKTASRGNGKVETLCNPAGTAGNYFNIVFACVMLTHNGKEEDELKRIATAIIHKLHPRKSNARLSDESFAGLVAIIYDALTRSIEEAEKNDIFTLKNLKAIGKKLWDMIKGNDESKTLVDYYRLIDHNAASGTKIESTQSSLYEYLINPLAEYTNTAKPTATRGAGKRSTAAKGTAKPKGRKAPADEEEAEVRPATASRSKSPAKKVTAAAVATKPKESSSKAALKASAVAEEEAKNEEKGLIGGGKLQTDDDDEDEVDVSGAEEKEEKEVKEPKEPKETKEEKKDD